MGGSIDNIISGITAPVPQAPAQTEQEEATPLPTAKKVGRKKKQEQNAEKKQERGSVAHEFFNMFFGETEKAPMKENRK